MKNKNQNKCSLVWNIVALFVGVLLRYLDKIQDRHLTFSVKSPAVGPHRVLIHLTDLKTQQFARFLATLENLQSFHLLWWILAEFFQHRALIGTLAVLFAFGCTILDDPRCECIPKSTRWHPFRRTSLVEQFYFLSLRFLSHFWCILAIEVLFFFNRELI
jgi:hypothetical protein